MGGGSIEWIVGTGFDGVYVKNMGAVKLSLTFGGSRSNKLLVIYHATLIEYACNFGRNNNAAYIFTKMFVSTHHINESDDFGGTVVVCKKIRTGNVFGFPDMT